MISSEKMNKKRSGKMYIIWLGQSGYILNDEKTEICIDPYLSDTVNRLAGRTTTGQSHKYARLHRLDITLHNTPSPNRILLNGNDIEFNYDLTIHMAKFSVDSDAHYKTILSYTIFFNYIYPILVSRKRVFL